jgi:hypothetical protein
MKIENTLCSVESISWLIFFSESFYALFVVVVVVVVDFTIFQSNKLLVLACYCCNPDQPDRKERKKRGRRKKSTTKFTSISLTRLSSFFNFNFSCKIQVRQNAMHIYPIFSLTQSCIICLFCSSFLYSCNVVAIATSRFC